jgi:protein SCO1/2
VSQDNSFFKAVVWTATSIFLLAVVALFVINRAKESRAEIPVLGKLPNFRFVERDGRPFGLSDMKGKLNVADFIFTSCRGPCPVMATKMGELYDLYKTTDKVQLISISVDPECDSLPVLQEYALRQGVNDNRWVFLRGEMDSIKTLSEKGFMLAADDLPGNHSTKFVLVDQKGKIRGYYDGLSDASINILKADIRQLALESEEKE